MEDIKDSAKQMLEVLRRLRDTLGEKKKPSVSDTVTFTRSPESDSGWTNLGRALADQARMFGKFGEQHVMDAIAAMPEAVQKRLRCPDHGATLARTLAATVLVGELSNLLHDVAEDLHSLAEKAGTIVMVEAKSDRECRKTVHLGEIDCGGQCDDTTSAAASYLMSGIIEAAGLMLVRYKQPEKADKPAQTGSDACCS